MKWLRWGSLAVIVVCAIVAVVMPGITTLDRLRALVADVPPPIVIHSQRIVWMGPRVLESHSDGATWTRTCPIVIISRGILLKDGAFVGLPATIMSGPLKGTQRNPRFEIRDLTPQEREPSVIRFDLPDWRDADGDYQIQPPDVTLYQVTMIVPNDRPCADGYAGTSVYRLTIPDPPHAAQSPHRPAP
jgi:hypothetical protein